MKKRLAFFVLCARILAWAGAQATIPETEGTPPSFNFDELDTLPEGRALLAMTNPDYPVTPGDAYVLSFMSSIGLETSSLMVDSDFQVNLGVFGSVNARGQLFTQFRSTVEKLVSSAYSGSSPAVYVRSTGIFNVRRFGEVSSAGEYQAWGLLRLSSLFNSVKTPYSSYRAIAVRSRDGSVRTYDLFKASRYGDLSQNPYLRPGDEITFSRYERQVSVAGNVRRPAAYQILPGEDISDLIEKYADGLTDEADPSRVSVSRIVEGRGIPGEKIFLSYTPGSDFALNNRDSVLVLGINESSPAVWFEGALRQGQRPEGADVSILVPSARIPYIFLSGERLSTAVRAVRQYILPIADLEAAYIRRDSMAIPVNLAKYLYDKDFDDDQELVPGDVIVVPFRQLFVTVSGAVNAPDRLPYIPDRTWDYYVALAGGFDTDRNVGDSVVIVDRYGREQPKDRMIQPEDRIEARSNSLIYKTGRISSIITTVLTVVSLVLSIISLGR